jgi:DNA mismatch repair ATPase MutL
LNQYSRCRVVALVLVVNMADERRRIKLLNDQAAAAVRGSQVIGSVSRAVEELVRNSVEGFSKSCVISVGPNEIIVSDDGVGIDAEAMCALIGTEYCSNDEVTGSRKGETLRSLASLCVEMKVETACWHCENSVPRRMNSLGSSKIMVSEKLFRDGALVFFNRSSDISPAIIPNNHNKATKTGTVVTLRGLFHRHVVRRKHHTLAKHDKAYNGRELTQIRACLRLLALSYPCVYFELRDGTTDKVDLSFSPCLQTTASPWSLIAEAHALRRRLGEMYPDDFPPEDSTELSLEEDQSTFRAFGVLSIAKADDDVRNRDLEIICINGRLATHRARLADAIFSQMRQCRGSKTSELLPV